MLGIRVSSVTRACWGIRYQGLDQAGGYAYHKASRHSCCHQWRDPAIGIASAIYI